MKWLVTIILVLLFSNNLALAQETSEESMAKVEEALVGVINACDQHALSFTAKMLALIKPNNNKENEFKDMYIKQVKLCLEIASFKIKQASETIK